MKKLIFIFFLFPFLLNATDYYVSNSGYDTNSGTSIASPWRTIAKVNAQSFSAGDNIYFQRGGSWNETLVVGNSGTSGNPITYGAYGSGDKPKITGLTTVSGWSIYSGSIYRASVSASSPNLVTIDGVNTPMGRYPNSSSPYRWQSTDLTLDSYTSNSITDAALPITPDLDGAQIVVRSRQWVTETRTVNHSSHTLTLQSGSWYDGYVEGTGYFVRNHLSLLDSNNEWYYGGGYLYIYGNPNSKTVKITTRSNLVEITNKDYITLENLCLEGANSYAIYAGNCDYLIIDNCDILYGGAYGISCEGTNPGLEITNNIISNINDYGMYISSSTSGATIEYNDMSYIGYINGAGSSGDEGYTGIVAIGDNTTVRYNRMTYIGYDGIRAGGENSVFSYNFVNWVCLNKSDGAGYYSYQDFNTGKVVSYNIILNATPQQYGWSYIDNTSASAVYTDGCERVTFTDNVFAHCGKGMFINASRYITTSGNLCYDNIEGLEILTQSGELATNHSHTGNIYFAREYDQISFYVIARDLGDSYLYNWGTSNNNYFLRPIYDDEYIHTYYYAWGNPENIRELNLTEWQSASGKDGGSHSTPVNVGDDDQLHFIYNDSFETKYYLITGTLRDHANNAYTIGTTLNSFTGLVLMGIGSVTEVTGGGATVNTTAVTNITTTTATSGGNVTDDGGHTVTAKGVCWSTSINPTTGNTHTNDGTGEGTFISTLTGLQPNTTYYVRAYATNSEGTAYGGNVSFKTLEEGEPPVVETGIIKHTDGTAKTVVVGDKIVKR